MKPNQVRAELLRQHAELRGLIEFVRDIAERASRGAAVRDELHGEVARLADALRRHNLFEEEWLRAIDARVDGPARAGIDGLLEGHVREHEELHEAVVGIPTMPIKFAGVDVVVILKGVLEHMASEEGTIFAEDLARDDEVVPSQELQ